MADPIALPDIDGWESVDFDPVAPRNAERMEGRRTEMQIFGTPYWQATYRPGRLAFRDFGKMDAFMMLAGDGGDYFLAHDPFRPRPMAHDLGVPLAGTKAGGGAFNGTAVLTAITNSRAVTVSGLPANLQLRRGDYVEFRMSALKRSLHRIVADAQANGSGLVALSIRFGLDTQHFTTAAVVNFEKPACVMQIDPGSYKGTKSLRDRRPSFSATEVFPG